MTQDEFNYRFGGWGDPECKFSELAGQTIVGIEGKKGSEFIVLTLADGRQMGMAHLQDCCESVTLESIRGQLAAVIGHPVEVAEETSNSQDATPEGEETESYTWTYYYIRTAGGSLVIRWYGTSNGYYSESVDCRWLTPNESKEQRA